MPYKMVERREGDIDACYADCSKALEELGWETHRDMRDACRDTWRWQSRYPFGFQSNNNNNNNLIDSKVTKCNDECVDSGSTLTGSR